MLGVVAVVETQKVVDAAVVAGGPARGVFPIPLHRAQPQPGEISRKIRQQEEARVPRGQRRTTGKGPARSRRQGAAKCAIAIRRRHDAPGDGRARASAECPAERSARRRTGGSSAAERKKGRWMKLCAMVLEFHHTPRAMSGASGHTARTAACSAASATRIASRRENRQIPVRWMIPGDGCHGGSAILVIQAAPWLWADRS